MVAMGCFLCCHYGSGEMGWAQKAPGTQKRPQVSLRALSWVGASVGLFVQQLVSRVGDVIAVSGLRGLRGLGGLGGLRSAASPARHVARLGAWRLSGGIIRVIVRLGGGGVAGRDTRRTSRLAIGAGLGFRRGLAELVGIDTF